MTDKDLKRRARAWRRVFAFASSDTTRPAIASVHLELRDGVTTATATDGTRLLHVADAGALGVVWEVPDGADQKWCNVNVTRAALPLLAAGETLRVTFRAGHAGAWWTRAECAGVEVWEESRFPDFWRVIPEPEHLPGRVELNFATIDAMMLGACDPDWTAAERARAVAKNGKPTLPRLGWHDTKRGVDDAPMLGVCRSGAVGVRGDVTRRAVDPDGDLLPVDSVTTDRKIVGEFPRNSMTSWDGCDPSDGVAFDLRFVREVADGLPDLLLALGDGFAPARAVVIHPAIGWLEDHTVMPMRIAKT